MSKFNLNGLARRVSDHIKGLMLAQAFVIVRREGYQLRVATIDSKPVAATLNKSDMTNQKRINVDVTNGNIKRAWIG